jgi:small subunit ribosomal protein S9
MTEEKKTTKQYWVGLGRRKSSVALVKISAEKTNLLNGVAFTPAKYVETPFEMVGETGNFGLVVKVNGGGKMSQLTAMRMGIARALEKYNAEFRTSLKKAGFLTRDPREKERKKPGLRRARRAPQWAKR